MRRALLLLLVCAPAWAEEPGFELVKAPAPELRLGKKAAFSLTLLPRAGHRLLPDGPVLVRVAADGLRAERPLYQRADAVDPRAEAPRFELAVTPERHGEGKLTARLTFYLCKASRCRPVETEIDWPTVTP